MAPRLPQTDNLRRLVAGALQPPPGRGRIILALGLGVLCHGVFALAVATMITAMAFGMSRSFGSVPEPWRWPVNALLLLQFPLLHSLLLSSRGGRWLARLAPGGHGATLSTTIYALIASLQVLGLFALWTPSGVVWWHAGGLALGVLVALYSSAWLLLLKATVDAGFEVQSGALGWLSLLQARRPRFPPMPVHGLFRLVRHPIYLAFALTLWTVPVWTPDQLAVALTLTAYCVLAPRLKERRLLARHGDAFRAYRARVPYLLPGPGTRVRRPRDPS